VRRSYLSILILVATLVSIVATPAVTFADDDDDRRGRSGDNRGRGNDKDKDDDDDRNRGRGNDRRDNDRRDNDRFRDNFNDFRTVAICHATGSARNPFVFIRVPEESVAAHQAHGDIIGVTSRQDCDRQNGIPGISNGTINIGDAVCREGEPCTFTVWQSRGTTTANVTFVTEDVTATGGAACGTAGVDYVSQAGTVTVNAASTAPLTIQTCSDNLSGPDERFRVRLTGTTSGRINDAAGRGILLETSLALFGGNTTIVQSDALGRATVTWGSTGGIEHRVYFQLIPPGTPQGSLCAVGTQFKRFEPLATSGILDNLQINSAYCIQVRRLEANGTETILTGQGPTTGGATVAVANPTTCTELLPSTCTFPVTLTGGTTPVTVTYSVTGTATGGSACPPILPNVDFLVPTTNTLLVQPNVPAAITVTTCADGVSDPGETLTVTLLSAPGATITQATATGTIAG
jgi:hypothetical protein